MPNSRAACRWLIPSTWQARRTRAYKSTTFIPQAFRSPLRRKARQRANFAPPQPDYPAASVRDFLSAALTARSLLLFKHEGDLRSDAEVLDLIVLDRGLELLDVDGGHPVQSFRRLDDNLPCGVLPAFFALAQQFDDFDDRHGFSPGLARNRAPKEQPPSGQVAETGGNSPRTRQGTINWAGCPVLA